MRYGSDYVFLLGLAKRVCLDKVIKRLVVLHGFKRKTYDFTPTATNIHRNYGFITLY